MRCWRTYKKGDVPSGSTQSIADFFANPQFAAQENIVRVGDHRSEPIASPTTMPLFSKTPGRIEHLGLLHQLLQVAQQDEHS